MLRFMTMCSVILMLVSAFGLYWVNYQTRAIEANLSQSKREIVALDREISTLNAERAFLIRPERIEPAARALGMRPASGHQFKRLTSQHQ